MAVLEWQHLRLQLCFGMMARLMFRETTVRFNFSESCHILHLHVVGGMRTGSSTNFAVALCARRVGRIQENCRLHFAASDRRATRDGDFKMRVLVPPQQVALCFRTMDYELREQTGAFS